MLSTLFENRKKLSLTFSNNVENAGEVSLLFSNHVENAGEVSLLFSNHVESAGEVSLLFSNHVESAGETSITFSDHVESVNAGIESLQCRRQNPVRFTVDEIKYGMFSKHSIFKNPSCLHRYHRGLPQYDGYKPDRFDWWKLNRFPKPVKFSNVCNIYTKINI